MNESQVNFSLPEKLRMLTKPEIGFLYSEKREKNPNRKKIELRDQ